MKSIKSLKKQAVKAAGLSFKFGKLDDSVAKKFVKSFKALSLGQAIPSLTYYLRALNLEISKTTLTVMSATKITSGQQNSIENTLKKDFKILETQYEISPVLLGGIKVKIGDIIFDNSLKVKLHQVSEAINN